MSASQAHAAYDIAYKAYQQTSDGSTEEAQTALAMAMAAHAIALYETAETIKGTP